LRYAVIIEPSGNGFSAHIPDLPECRCTANTVDEVKRQIRDIVESRIEQLLRQGEPLPEPTSFCAYIEIGDPIDL
jgi:predicted RNase H-like HicB family nuclease